MHQHTAWHSAFGMAALVDAVRRAPIEPGMPVPEILIVAPPPAREAKGTMVPKFQGAEQKCVGLPAALENVARDRGCGFFDAGNVISVSQVDGVHLDADQHVILGRALAKAVAPLLARPQ